MRIKILSAALVVGSLLTPGCQSGAGGESDREKMEAKEKKAKEDIAKTKEAADRKKDDIDADTEKKVAKDREDIVKARAELTKEQREDGEKGVKSEKGDKPAVKKAAVPVVPTTTAKADAEKKQEKVIRGTLASAGKTITLRDANGEELKLKTDDQTKVTQNNAAVELKNFKEGTAVQATYEMNGEDRMARKLEVLGDAAPKK